MIVHNALKRTLLILASFTSFGILLDFLTICSKLTQTVGGGPFCRASGWKNGYDWLMEAEIKPGDWLKIEPFDWVEIEKPGWLRVFFTPFSRFEGTGGGVPDRFFTFLFYHSVPRCPMSHFMKKKKHYFFRF